MAFPEARQGVDSQEVPPTTLRELAVPQGSLLPLEKLQTQGKPVSVVLCALGEG